MDNLSKVNKAMTKLLKGALKKDSLYSNDEIIFMKKELANIQNQIKLQRKLSRKGFGE